MKMILLDYATQMKTDNLPDDLDEIERERAKIIQIIHEESGWFKPKDHTYRYLIAHGSIGDTITMHCTSCKRRWNITNYDRW